MALPVQHLAEDSPIVVLNYADLVANKDLSASVGEAFGHSGLGLLVVKGVPSFVEKKHAVLPLAHKFANLPAETKKKYERPDVCFQVGWDHGNETMSDGKPDLSKGSYYANPLVDEFPDKEAVQKHPMFYAPNVWPEEDVPEFESAFKALARLIVEVGRMVMTQADAFVQGRLETDEMPTTLSHILQQSRKCAGRLLHYFPRLETVSAGAANSSNEDGPDGWCGWHNDHGSLTGLCGAIYHDEKGNVIKNTDPQAGLYIKTRAGELVKASGIPGDYMLFQIGETSQIMTGGLLKATPHMVAPPLTTGVSRSTMAVFMEPEHDEPLCSPASRSHTDTVHCPHLPKGVPTLASRWEKEGKDTFGSFGDRTVKAYYPSLAEEQH